MPVEFIGHVFHHEMSEIIPQRGPLLDWDYIARQAQAQEEAGFDRVLVPHLSSFPDGMQIAFHVLGVTTRLHMMLAQRPGFVAPSLAARQLATLDHFSKGRAGIHVITGASDIDQRRDGDFLDHDTRYARTAEYIDILKLIWTSDAPVDYRGTHYQLEGAFSSIKPVQRPGIPIFFGGASEPAVAVAARHAEVYAMMSESRAGVAEQIARVRDAAALQGRADAIRFSLSVRAIIAPTESQAWDKAAAILDRTRTLVGDSTPETVGRADNVITRRVLDAADRGRVLDERLWTELATLTGAKGSSLALVGTPEQVADSLLRYHALGIDMFLIRGFDPVADAIDFGRTLIPLVRRAT